MNVLSLGERVRVASALVDGCSVRATERIAEVSRPAINNLLLRLGVGCSRLSDAMMRGLHCDVLELDEVWCFVAKKEARVQPDDPPEYGDTYTWVALDARTKLIPVHLVEKRSTAACNAFATELRARVVGAPQITTDGHKAYLEAIERAFGARVRYAQILKEYRGDEAGGASRDDVRYSRGRVKRSVKRVILGAPDEARISTSYVERSNLTTRMGLRRFTRLTNAFSKRLENLRAAVALHFAHYNLCRVHQTLRVTPAMEAGVTDRVWSLDELVTAALDAPEPAPLAPPEAPPSTKPTAPSAPPGSAPRNVVLPGQLPFPGFL
jgi:IS1 family transposase